MFDVVDPSDTINQLKVQFSDRTILFNKVDVRNKAEIESAFKIAVDAFGTVDVLANIAGICNESKVEDMLHVNLVCFSLFFSKKQHYFNQLVSSWERFTLQ